MNLKNKERLWSEDSQTLSSTPLEDKTDIVLLSKRLMIIQTKEYDWQKEGGGGNASFVYKQKIKQIIQKESII